MSRILRRIGRALGLGRGPREGSSAAYELIAPDAAADREGLDGWREQTVAERQDAAYRRLLDAMHAGNPRVDLVVAADAVRAAGIENPELLEIGCGSGYYSQVLPYLLDAPIRYTGLDYSDAMIAIARRNYPATRFIVGDATALPFENGAFDIALNGAALMHIARYEEAIAESRRVARRWCIFHTVTVHQHRPTTFLRKKAYGAPTVEVSFNEGELLAILERAGLRVRWQRPSVAYDLGPVLGEPTVSKTYLCEVAV